jgi:hypothetical protein
LLQTASANRRTGDAEFAIGQVGLTSAYAVKEVNGLVGHGVDHVVPPVR